VKKIISFCLWGSDPKYCVGAIRNAEICKQFYPDWKCRFYAHNSVPKHVIAKIESIPDTEIVLVDQDPNWQSMFWRFLPASDPTVDIFICRDCDSRLSQREVEAVKEWQASDKMVHIMRDHPHHGFTMLGGMIGFKKESFELLTECLKKFQPLNHYGTDYVFFKQVLYPQVKDAALVHDPFFEKKPFPSKRVNYEFVGQVFDENEVTVQDHIEALKRYI
jgi:hypothetical protein